MARHDPLFPNAAIVARREYVDRVRSRLYRISTVILMALAVAVALTPIMLRYLDRSRIDVIAVVAPDDQLALGTIATANGIMNIPPPGVSETDWTKPYRIERHVDGEAAIRELEAGRIDAIIEVIRRPDRHLEVTYRTNGPADSVKSQLAGFVALSVGILDWTSSLPRDSELGTFQTPTFETRSLIAPTEGGRQVDAVVVASRGFLGTVFIILMFITILIYGMWVATGVATEKSSRVMELMISAASPRQLLVGKVLGIGGAGLTQYLAIAVPAVLVLAFQDEIAGAVLGAGGAGPARRVRRVLPAGLRALRAHLCRGRIVRQPAGRPADAVAAPEPRRDGRLPVGIGRASWRRGRVAEPARVTGAALQPIRDARAADGERRAPGRGRRVGRDPAGDHRIRVDRDGADLRDRGSAVRAASGATWLHRRGPSRRLTSRLG
jgi:hypothetical protein